MIEFGFEFSGMLGKLRTRNVVTFAHGTLQNTEQRGVQYAVDRRGCPAQRLAIACCNRQHAALLRQEATSRFCARSCSSDQGAQHRDERFVGRRHRVVGKLAGAHPGKLLTEPRGDVAFPVAAHVERHEEMEAVVLVAREGERREALLGDGDAELFVEFTHERRFGALAGLDLAARELPQTRHRFPGRTFRQ